MKRSAKDAARRMTDPCMGRERRPSEPGRRVQRVVKLGWALPGYSTGHQGDVRFLTVCGKNRGNWNAWSPWAALLGTPGTLTASPEARRRIRRTSPASELMAVPPLIRLRAACFVSAEHRQSQEHTHQSRCPYPLGDDHVAALRNARRDTVRSDAPLAMRIAAWGFPSKSPRHIARKRSALVPSPARPPSDHAAVFEPGRKVRPRRLPKSAAEAAPAFARIVGTLLICSIVRCLQRVTFTHHACPNRSANRRRTGERRNDPAPNGTCVLEPHALRGVRATFLHVCLVFF